MSQEGQIEEEGEIREGKLGREGRGKLGRGKLGRDLWKWLRKFRPLDWWDEWRERGKWERGGKLGREYRDFGG
jgi:hypothetical protein